MRVLLADDSILMLDRLQKMLCCMEDVEVVGSFHNGTDALSGMYKLKPDMAILDNKMPGLKGIEVIQEIRKENQSVKLMLLTLYYNMYYRQQAMNAGADYFFSKSEDFEKILEVIAELVKNEKDIMHQE